MISPMSVEVMAVDVQTSNSFNMAQLFPRLDMYGRDLVTRALGERALPLLQDALRAIPRGMTLTLDLREIAVMDTSFTDAAVLALHQELLAGQYGDRFLGLAHANPTVIENLEGALARRRVKTPILVRGHQGLQLVGHLERNLREAWFLVAASRVSRARELADHLGLDIGAASMRLHKLAAAKLLTRREESTASGRQHIYGLPA